MKPKRDTKQEADKLVRNIIPPTHLRCSAEKRIQIAMPDNVANL
ncbi:MAG: hypothetical protein AB7T38_07310 [Nitrospirales bacterium]